MYRPEYPAISLSQSQTDVSVSVNIVYVDGLDAVAMLFRVKIQIFMEWFDSR
jgi:hypothetical protein